MNRAIGSAVTGAVLVAALSTAFGTGVWGSDETGIYSLNIEPLPYLRQSGMPANAPGAQGGGPVLPV
jgi:hypothetical protein